jgi:hypothetical protein
MTAWALRTPRRSVCRPAAQSCNSGIPSLHPAQEGSSDYHETAARVPAVGPRLVPSRAAKAVSREDGISAGSVPDHTPALWLLCINLGRLGKGGY